MNGYWKYAILNIVFNILSVVFSLFSLSMVAPFLNLLFLTSDAELAKQLSNVPMEFSFSVKSFIEYINHYLAQIIITKGKIDALVFICVLVTIVMFIKNFFRYLAMYFLAPIRNGVVKDLRNEMFNKTLVLPMAYYSEERKGDIMSRMTADVQEIEWSIMNSLEMIFRDPLNIVFFLITMVYMSPQLTLFVFILLPLTGLVIARIARSLRRTSTTTKEKMGVLLSMIEETLSGLRIIKAFNAEKSVSRKFYDENDSYTNLMIRMYRKVDLSSPLSEFLGTAVMMIIMYFGGKLVLGESHSLSPEIFITYIIIFSQLIPPAKSFTTAYYNIEKGLASAERISKITNAEVSIKESIDPKSINSFEKEIEYQNVSFAYREGEVGWVLKNINVKIQKGKAIALVGQSGSGKTTMADILPRFYDPSQGKVLIDGIDIKEAKIFDLRKLLGVVTQESILFNDTVLNNIAFGINNVKKEDVIEAAKIANAHDFIMQMPDGYQSNIGDRGSKLSGGQRQRLSIARAILKNPPILILDEATSALDTESEKLVQDALNKLMKNRTSIIIAHRLSTIQHADEIIVLQKGEIIERGNHAELLSKNGAYKKLSDMQAFV